MRNATILSVSSLLVLSASFAGAQSLGVAGVTSSNVREASGFVTATASSVFNAAARGGHAGNFSQYVDRNTGSRLQGPSGSPMAANTRYTFSLTVTPGTNGGSLSWILNRPNNTTINSTYSIDSTKKLSHLTLGLNSGNANFSFNVKDVTFSQGAFTQVLLSDETRVGNIGEGLWNVTGDRLRNGQAFTITGSVLATGNYSGETGRFRVQAWQGEPVPEPATLAVLGAGALAMIRRRRNRA